MVSADEGSVLSRGESGNSNGTSARDLGGELDDVLAKSKVIAEAWDAAGLYQIGYFPGADGLSGTVSTVMPFGVLLKVIQA